MAYESMTYDLILQRMLKRVSTSYPNLDTRQGSVIYNALAPAAIELAIAYTELDNVLNESFVDTASRPYLYLACEEMGIDTSVFDPSVGTFQGEFDVEVPIGSRWNCDLYNYIVEELIGQDEETNYYKYKLTCETLGSAPNSVTGTLTAITTIPSGLTYAQLTECLIEGEDASTDDEIRAAYYEYIDSAASDGNIGQYERWCAEYDGIGNHKIIPLWNGANTVKVSILSTSNRAASDELIASFQEYLDPGTTGMGDGEAPIGAFVTVSTATEVPIDVACEINLRSGYSSVPDIDGALENYFSSVAYERTLLSYMNIGAVILAVDGIDSISNLTINGGTADITVGNEEIPIVGTTNWTVV